MKDSFSSLTTTYILLTITLTIGSQTIAKGIGLAHHFPSLHLTFVLYTLKCPFNLISINTLTRNLNYYFIFFDKSMTLQDWSTGETIDIGRESQVLYHLNSSLSHAACISMDALLLIHSRLGHPILF